MQAFITHDIPAQKVNETASMGGKTWTRDEEAYFWIVIVPLSPRAAREEDRLRTWTASAAIMNRMLGRKARRKYTPSMLCMLPSFALSMLVLTMVAEHYFQNVTTGHISPQARVFVEEHMEELGRFLNSKKCHDGGTLTWHIAEYEQIRELEWSNYSSDEEDEDEGSEEMESSTHTSDQEEEEQSEEVERTHQAEQDHLCLNKNCSC